MSAADSESDVIPVDQDLAVGQFCAFTGSSREAAKQALEACNWNLEMAVNMQMDYGEPTDSIPPLISSSSSSGSAQPSTSSTLRSTDEDNVRAPIPPKRQVLVDDFADMDVPIYPHRTRSSQIPMYNNMMRDFQREARFREEMAAASASGSGVGENVESEATKRQTLEDLFRPPLDLMFQGSFENAKDKGVRDNRWIMINVQDETEFSCQILNRDVWSNAAVKSIIEEHFVFWQVYKNSREGLRYMQFYPVNQFPYIAILDPRTGENLKCWHSIQDSNMFCELVTDFLQDHPTPSGDPIPDSVPLPQPSASKPVEVLNHHSMSEEEQLKAAIAASLQEPIRICDDDDDDIETFSSDGEKESDSPVELQQNHVNESQDTEKETNDSEATATAPIEDCTVYLGSDTVNTSLVLRFPDGQREVLTVPCDTKLKYVLLLVQSKGFSLSQYDIMAFHPRRLVHEMSPDAPLSGLGLLKEQLFIQLKQ